MIALHRRSLFFLLVETHAFVTELTALGLGVLVLATDGVFHLLILPPFVALQL